VTDSAASATAYSCGIKSYNGAIGVDDDYEPCGTVLEAAHLQGMSPSPPPPFHLPLPPRI
jgi:alkaline phosphatase